MRILPVYWFTFVLALLLVFMDNSSNAKGTDVKILGGDCTVFLFIGQLAGAGLNRPAWIFSTLVFFCYNFPW